MNLVYTVAIDDRGSFFYRNLAKLLVSSVLRSGFAGTVVVFHNGEQPLFQISRQNLYEERIEVSEAVNNLDSSPIASRWSAKHGVSPLLLEYEWSRALFLDADCIVTGDLTSLFNGEWELAVYREPGQCITLPQFNCFLSETEMQELTLDGVNSGAFCVDRKIAALFFKLWAGAQYSEALRYRRCDDQAALNRVLLDHRFSTTDFTHMVSMPFHTDTSRKCVEKAEIVHFVGAAGGYKLRAAYGLFMERYFWDPSLTLFNLLET